VRALRNSGSRRNRVVRSDGVAVGDECAHLSKLHRNTTTRLRISVGVGGGVGGAVSNRISYRILRSGSGSDSIVVLPAQSRRLRRRRRRRRRRRGDHSLIHRAQRGTLTLQCTHINTHGGVDVCVVIVVVVVGVVSLIGKK
jgi:hypothetical protein